MACRWWGVREISSLPPTGIDLAHTSLCVQRVLQIEHAERGFQQMTTQIPQGSGSVIPPAAPAAGRHTLHIVSPGSSSQPQIPVYMVRNRTLLPTLNTLLPDRTIAPDLNRMHITNKPCVVPFVQ